MSSTWKKFKLKGGFNNPNNLSLFLDGVLESGMVSGALGLLVAVVFFFIMYAAYRQVGGAAIGPRPRAVWMWDDLQPPAQGSTFESVKVVSSPGPYLAWAKVHNVVETWIDVSGLYDKQSSLFNFLKLAKEQGMSTHFLASTTPAVLNDPLGTGVDALKELLGLVSKVSPEHRPSSVQTNIENIWKATADKDKDKFFDEKAGILFISAATALSAHKTYKKLIEEANLVASASVLYWWIPFEGPNVDIPLCDVNGKQLPYGEALLATGWDVTVQDYRTPPIASYLVPPAQGWSKLAGKHGRSAYVGLAVGPPSAGTYAYYDAMTSPVMSDALLEKDINMISDACLDESGFAGMAVHTAAWYGSATGNK